MVGRSIWFVGLANNLGFSFKIENALAIDVLDQCLKILTNCNAVLNPDGAVIVLAIFRPLLI
jgi:hypothetical protein